MKYSRLLQQLKGKAMNKLEVFGFDVETEHIRKDFDRKSGKTVKAWQQNFVMGSIVGDDYKKVFWDRDEMGDYLLKRKFRGSYLVATNLEFDFMQLYGHRIKDFNLIYRHSLLAAIRSEKDVRDKKGKYKWTFVDTNNYIKAPLSKLGEIVGIPKLPKPAVMEDKPEGLGLIARRPKNEEEKQELIDYNVNDSLITYKTAELFKQFCTEHNMKMKLTIGSTGMDYWRRNHQPHGLVREPERLLNKHFDGAFRGGATVTYKRGSYNDKLWYYDYRSSYPGVMDKGVDGKGSYPHPSTFVHTTSPTTELIDDYEGICKAEVDMPYSYMPMLGYRTESKLLFPYGTFSGWFTNYELRKAMDAGAEVNPLEMIYYHTLWKPFKNAVNVLYDLRKKYKKWTENNDGTYTKHPFEAMVKTLMNSGLFGKWGTNYMNMEELIDLDDVIFGDDGRPMKDGKPVDGLTISPSSDEFGGLGSIKKVCKPFRYSFPILSSYTTMLGRMKLHTDLKGNEKYLVMTDTDSAVMTKPVLQEGFGIGDWELEHVCERGVFIRPKMYMIKPVGLPTICKNKGVGRFTGTEERFTRALATGGVRMERFTRMKESARMGVKSGTVMELYKRMGLEDNKRLWERDFDLDDWQDSEPIKLTLGLRESKVRDAHEAYIAKERTKRLAFVNSDLFDKHMVGKDISSEEFLENEKWFAINE